MEVICLIIYINQFDITRRDTCDNILASDFKQYNIDSAYNNKGDVFEIFCKINFAYTYWI